MNTYEYVGKLSEGLRRFKIGVYPNFKCGFIDEHGNEVIPPIYSNVRDFHEGLAAVKMGNWAAGKWGFVNKLGVMVVGCSLSKPRRFSDGYAKAILNDEWCFIDQNGSKVISLKGYDGGSSFHNGYAIVCKSKSAQSEMVFGIIDKHGNEVVPCSVACFKAGSFFSCNNLRDYVDLQTTSI